MGLQDWALHVSIWVRALFPHPPPPPPIITSPIKIIFTHSCNRIHSINQPSNPNLLAKLSPKELAEKICIVDKRFFLDDFNNKKLLFLTKTQIKWVLIFKRRSTTGFVNIFCHVCMSESQLSIPVQHSNLTDLWPAKMYPSKQIWLIRKKGEGGFQSFLTYGVFNGNHCDYDLKQVATNISWAANGTWDYARSRQDTSTAQGPSFKISFGPSWSDFHSNEWENKGNDSSG